MWTRREWLSRVGAAGAATLHPDGLTRILGATRAIAQRVPEDVARDEDYWREIQSAFTLDRAIINLNNGAICPTPRVVHEAYKRYLDISNQAPAYYMWDVLEPNLDAVRDTLAADVGVDADCLAITRNATEALHIAQLGLDLKPGDEVLTTNQDYPRMLRAWEQRQQRDGIRVTKLSFPVPASQTDLVRRFEQAITPATRVMHFCHIINLTGQIFPVRELCALARTRGLVSIVDGAQAYAHVPFRVADFDPDYYGTSLHKWLLAPVGTGFLYVRRNRIAAHWPLTPGGGQSIKKFEEIGTHSAASHNAIAEALAFHHGIGIERKAARLRYLKNYWATRVRDLPGMTLHTSLAPADSCGIGTVGLKNHPAGDVQARLWSTRRIMTGAMTHPEFEGVRVTPNIYTTLLELDQLVDELAAITRG